MAPVVSYSTKNNNHIARKRKEYRKELLQEFASPWNSSLQIFRQCVSVLNKNLCEYLIRFKGKISLGSSLGPFENCATYNLGF